MEKVQTEMTLMAEYALQSIIESLSFRGPKYRLYKVIDNRATVNCIDRTFSLIDKIEREIIECDKYLDEFHNNPKLFIDGSYKFADLQDKIYPHQVAKYQNELQNQYRKIKYLINDHSPIYFMCRFIPHNLEILPISVSDEPVGQIFFDDIFKIEQINNDIIRGYRIDIPKGYDVIGNGPTTKYMTSNGDAMLAGDINDYDLYHLYYRMCTSNTVYCASSFNTEINSNSKWRICEKCHKPFPIHMNYDREICVDTNPNMTRMRCYDCEPECTHLGSLRHKISMDWRLSNIKSIDKVKELFDRYFQDNELDVAIHRICRDWIDFNNIEVCAWTHPMAGAGAEVELLIALFNDVRKMLDLVMHETDKEINIRDLIFDPELMRKS